MLQLVFYGRILYLILKLLIKAIGSLIIEPVESGYATKHSGMKAGITYTF